MILGFVMLGHRFAVLHKAVQTTPPGTIDAQVKVGPPQRWIMKERNKALSSTSLLLLKGQSPGFFLYLPASLNREDTARWYF